MKIELTDMLGTNPRKRIYTVIEHKTLIEVIKPLRTRLAELESLNKNQLKKKKVELETVTDELKEWDFLWCTDKSAI